MSGSDLKFKVDENEKVLSAPEIFWSWLKYHGLKYTASKSYQAVANKFNVFSFMRDNLALSGILDGARAFCGPELVEIDLTNNCNCRCVGCWCHSSMLGDGALKGSEKLKCLPYEMVVSLIDDLCAMGTKAVQISGSGEPFMHPRIMDILRYIKGKSMRCAVITNFTLVDARKVKELVEIGLDNITASIWAGTAAIYAKTHPGMRENDFYRIEDMLKLLYLMKGERAYPHVKIYNVISSLNCRDLSGMLDFARRVRADFLEFAVVDTIPGKTDALSLSDPDRSAILEQCVKMEEAIDYPRSPQWGVEIKKIKLMQAQHKQEILGFGKYRKHPFSRKQKEELASLSGGMVRGEVFGEDSFNFELDQLNQLRVWCPAGKSTHRQHYDENLNAFVFQFTRAQCLKCSLRCWCFESGASRKVSVKYLSLLGFGTFYRRVMSMGEAAEEKKDCIVDTLPCYAGWVYSRVRVNGDVIPCCKACGYPVGNLYKSKFKEVWRSDKQKRFRTGALSLKKSGGFLAEIGCQKSCDNLGGNLQVHKRLVALTGAEKKYLRMASKIFGRV